MSKASNILPGIAAYPDLEKAMVVALRQAGCCSGKQNVIARFRRRLAERDKRDKTR